MSVRATKPPPTVVTILSAIDVSARETVNRARRVGVPAVRAGISARASGKLASSIGGRVARTATGYAFSVAPTSRVRYPSGVSAVQVLRFVQGGTGVFGPLGRPIRARGGHAFRLPPSTVVESIQGQHPQGPVLARAAARVSGVIIGILDHGATQAARAAERAF